MRIPRLTLPRTSPEMYAEYWKPMNWKSITPAININGQEVSDDGPKLNPDVRPAPAAAVDSCSTVTPLAYFGRFAANVAASKNKSPKTPISAQPAIPRTVREVTILWKRRVGWRTTSATRPITTRPASIPGTPVMLPDVPSVNQLLALAKKSLPVPIPMIRPCIWTPRRVSEVSNWMSAIAANASIQLSIQPRNGPIFGTIRLVNT